MNLAAPKLLPYIMRQRWFAAKGRTAVSARLGKSLPIGQGRWSLGLVKVAYAQGPGETYLLPLRAGQDATQDPGFHGALLSLFRKPSLPSRVLDGEQSNTSIIYGSRWILKLYRRLSKGANPELEIAAHLTAAKFPFAPALLGHLDSPAGHTLALLQEFVPNEGDAWRRLPNAKETRLLGIRLAQLHLALANGKGGRAFKPEPLSLAWRRSAAQSMTRLLRDHFRLLRSNLAPLSKKDRSLACDILNCQDNLPARFSIFATRPLGGSRIRCHGDLHLGQVLRTKKDFIFIDFEGEPSRSLEERREKQPPAKDLAGMLRSFHYAQAFHRLGQDWLENRTRGFLSGYFGQKGIARLWPKKQADLERLLDVYQLEKAVYELGYELNHRPDWARIPLEGMKQIIRG